MRESLFAAVVCVFLLPQSHARASEDSFILYLWACPDLQADEKAREAFLHLDEDAFEDTGCVSIRPETTYKILRCDSVISDKHLEKFDYPIERTEELTFLGCEISVTTADGHSETLLLDFGTLILLEPRSD